MYAQDPFELVSALLMFYATAIGIYITLRAIRVGLPYFLLSVLLSLMTLFHGLHHLSGYLGSTMLEETFELGASVSAVVLGVLYVYVWRKP